MKAQWEAREFATQVLEEARDWAPLTFEAYEEYTNNNSLRAP
jgi:thymidylate synthase (FAD)